MPVSDFSACSSVIFPNTLADRKAIEEAYAEEVDSDDFLVEDETKYLNMNEEEGECAASPSADFELMSDTEDVWDEDSAYLEMLAKEVFYRSISWTTN